MGRVNGMGVIVKRPLEADDFGFDFLRRPRIVAGDTVASVVSITATRLSGSGSLTIGSPSVSGAIVTVRISGGTDGDRYRIECTVLTTQGATLVSEMPMVVTTLEDGTVE
jgi:hypothetical protein